MTTSSTETSSTETGSTDEIPFFPADAPAALADAGTARGLLAPVLADLADAVAAVREEDLDRPTPCPGFDVGALRDHVLGWLDLFGAAFTDPRGGAPRPDPGTYRAGADGRDPVDVVRTAARRLDDALATGVLDGEVVMSQSRMTGPAALGMVLGEYVVHGWDLARALGRPWTPAAEAADVARVFFTGVVVPAYRSPDAGFFGPELPVADDAPALDRLLAFAGRDAAWRP